MDFNRPGNTTLQVIIPGRTLLIENFGVPASGFQSEMWQACHLFIVFFPYRLAEQCTRDCHWTTST
jgi:hypothetical protein